MSKPIHVVMIIQDYLSRVGGAQWQLIALGPFLQSLDVTVSVITRRYPGLSAFDVFDGVSVHRASSPGPKDFASAIFTLTALPVLKRIKPDIIHVHGMLSPLTTGLAGKKLTGAPLVAKVLGGGDLGDLNRLKSKLFGRLRMDWMRKFVDRFLVISEEIDRSLADLGIPADKRVQLPNGVDIDKYSPASVPEKRALRESLELPNESLVCVFSGRMVEEKQLPRLLSVWSELTHQYPGALLVILGSGPQEDTLKQMAGRNVRMTGFSDKVDAYLKAADLFVLPSTREGLSNAMLEAMASGLAVVTTTVGGALDVIDHGVHGWLVDPKTRDSLKGGLDKLLSDRDLRLELGASARQKMVEEYAFPVIAQRVREVYEHLLDD